MHHFDPAAYGPVLAPLVSGDRDRALDQGDPDPAMRGPLSLATAEASFAHAPLADRDMAACCIAGLWLVHDFLDESHAISQHVNTPAGAYWHAMMHRREGDFGNAKYWLRRVGEHSVFDEMPAALSVLGSDSLAAEVVARVTRQNWFDPYAMVDACERASRTTGPDAQVLRRLQQIEWELLFEHCYRHAVAA